MRFDQKITQSLCLFFMVFALVGCGFHLRSATTVPEPLKTIQFSSYDLYNETSSLMLRELQLNGIKIAKTDETNITLPTLRLLNESTDKQVISVYPDGKAAEYRLVLQLNAQLLIPNKGLYPLSVKTTKTFFDNPSTALGKSEEQRLIMTDMRKMATQLLSRKLISIRVDGNHEQ